MISGRSLLRRGIASVDGALTGRVQARHRGHRQLAGRRRDNVPKGGRMRARGCGYVVGSGGDEKVIEEAWRWHRSWRVGRPKPGPASEAVRKEGPFVS